MLNITHQIKEILNFETSQILRRYLESKLNRKFETKLLTDFLTCLANVI